jgi:alginate O-acetyltransferase complex protein AlgI
MFSAMGYQMKSTWTLRIILPVGISFYTFQTMSYSFDIYYKKLKPTKSFISFAAFVAFFLSLLLAL